MGCWRQVERLLLEGNDPVHVAKPPVAIDEKYHVLCACLEPFAQPSVTWRACVDANIWRGLGGTSRERVGEDWEGPERAQ
eukprot:3255583-Prymnesium_polylepis.1